MSERSIRVIVGDVRRALELIADKSVQCVVTSPPYWGLRDYGNGAQIGLERTPDKYVEQIVHVFRDVRRVLRDDGTLWLVIGDCYAGSGKGATHDKQQPKESYAPDPHSPQMRIPKVALGFKPKDLIGIPWRVALAMQADGWHLRSEIIWQKPNAMPESVTDRPARSHETIFLFSKKRRYYYDEVAVREPVTSTQKQRSSPFDYKHGLKPPPRTSGNLARKLRGDHGGVEGSRSHQGFAIPWTDDGSGRTRRSVWTVATKAFKGAHFATFPPPLIEPCLRASTSEHGVCACGAPWARIVEKRTSFEGGSGAAGRSAEHVNARGKHRLGTPSTRQKNLKLGPVITRETVGWRPTCQCDEPTSLGRSLVLDPFGGVLTTALVADRLGLNAVCVELNPTYATMGVQRLQVEPPSLAHGMSTLIVDTLPDY